MKHVVSSITLVLSAVSFLSATEHHHYNLVPISSVNSRIIIDTKYATDANFMHKKLYPTTNSYVHTTVAQKLHNVQLELESMGLGLKIFDAYRPLYLEEAIRSAAPEHAYVSTTPTGCAHNRGIGVDVTLVKADGSPVQMPSEFDDFTFKTHRSYNDKQEAANANRDLLEKIMVKYGFISYSTNWWHFELPHAEHYPLLEVSFETLAQ